MNGTESGDLTQGSAMIMIVMLGIALFMAGNFVGKHFSENDNSDKAIAFLLSMAIAFALEMFVLFVMYAILTALGF